MTARNWLNITQQCQHADGGRRAMTIVMVMGDFDLSVGSMASLAGRRRGDSLHVWISGLGGGSIALLVGLVGGAINGVARQHHRHPAVRRDTCDADDLLRRGVPDQRRQDDLRTRHPGRASPILREGASRSVRSAAAAQLPNLTHRRLGRPRDCLGAARADHIRPTALRDRRQHRSCPTERRARSSACG